MFLQFGRSMPLNMNRCSVDRMAVRWMFYVKMVKEDKFAIVNLQHENLLTI